MLDGSGRRTADGSRHVGRAVRGKDDAGRARRLGAPADRAEIARVGDLVETDDERLRRGRQLKGIGVAVRLAQREYALMIGGTGCGGQVALGLDLHARAAVAEPWLGAERPLAGPELEHLASPAKRLPNRAATIDLLADHCFGTSWEPSVPP